MKGHPAEEVMTLKDDGGKEVVASQLPPVTSSTENHRHGKHGIKLPKFRKGLRNPKDATIAVDSASPIDHHVEEVKDGNRNGEATSEQPPLTLSTENREYGKHKLKFLKFRKVPKSLKAAEDLVDCTTLAELSFKENIMERHLKEAGHQLIIQEEHLFQQNAGQEGVEREGWEKEEDELLKDYEILLNQVWLAIQDSFSAEPGVLDALRSAVSLILQEEEQNQRWLKGEGVEAPAWRPRQCRQTHDALLQTMVKKRMECIEGVAVVEGLSSSLKKEVYKMGKQVHSDLLKVVRDVKPCYPSEFNVCNTYAQLYHQAFSTRLVKITESDPNLEELAYLLSWVHNYYPNDVLKHKELEKDIDREALGPLLPEAVGRSLEEQYFSQKGGQLELWMSNALKLEENNWRTRLPELTLDEYYFSPIAIDIIEMVDTAVKETKTIFSDLSRAQKIVCQLEMLILRYKKSLEEFMKAKHVNTHAVLKANLACIECLKEYVEKCVDLLPEENSKRCLALLEDMESCAYGYFLDIVHFKCKVQYKQLWTQAWLAEGGRELLEQLESHISDCRNLKASCKQELVSRLHVQVMLEYVRRMMKGKVKLKNKEHQERAASLLCEDSKMLNSIFIEDSKERWLRDILPKIAEVFRLQDPETIQLEVITLAQCFPDLSDKHVSALLHVRNLPSAHIRRIKASLAANRPSSSPENTHPFFARVRLSKLTTMIQ